MSKVAYLECPTGIAGDMCLGALIDIGVPLEYLIEKLDCLGIAGEYKLWAESVQRNGQRATKLHVELDGESTPHSHTAEHASDHHAYSKLRHLPEIEQMICGAHLPARALAWSLAVFRQLAAAEGAVHGIAPEQVHFHEVGAIDAIVDVVGTCLGLEWLGIDRLYCSAFPTGGGTIRAAHGRLPVPVPAVLKLWEMRQVPIYSNGIERELVTPTGAAIATAIATDFGAPPQMTLQQVGLGAGSLALPLPNILRLWIGESSASSTFATLTQPSSAQQFSDFSLPSSASLSTVALLETQIDDLNPQAIGYLFDVLFQAGAVDVFTQAIGMKKSRPGVLLTVLCPPDHVSACEAVLFQETSTLGIRHSVQQRSILERGFQQVETGYGAVSIKIASRGGAIVNVQPEYEDCADIARHHHLAWREVHRLALQSWYLQHPQPNASLPFHSH
ncbi:nickel pincer cofactor biosynthesis protein LarC [Myxacorys almedinensis]|uniref:Putative nickel insertion protein n=1 Tax=Myxacorys almedinensis A TaxID=2690445 RepID=A0A8J7Z5X6_9CYAN|nr:nickel pincer cofactor biosynthesis protein LarC [Myxacorys almedinensis]NDJ18683.1 nickel pincer cofactor biosynthesis protein LarC [Myxacorys almedinensis A]